MLLRNAIEVKNIGGTKVGHVPKQTAAKLSPLLDRGAITVEGVMHEGNCKSAAHTIQVGFPETMKYIVSGFSYSLSM